MEASTIGEAIRHVTLMLPGFRPNAKTGHRQVQAAGCTTIEDYFTPTDQTDIHLMPAFHGGKNGGFLQIIIGAVLIAASFIPGLNVIAPLLLKVGIMMLLGGVLQLLAAPARDKNGDQKKSHYLGTPRNTVDIGTRIPILYGRRKIGGHYLSFNISAVDVGI